MTDNISPEKRSEVMSRVRSKDTTPELLIRKGLHAQGFRYRLHAKDMPGKPDLVFPRYKSVILIHGCFWHGHSCHLYRFPKSNTDYWKRKIARNITRDVTNRQLLYDKGWRVLIIWECAIKGRERLEFKNVVELAAAWLRSANSITEIKGTWVQEPLTALS